MSNSWFYAVIFPPRKSATDTIRDVLELVKRRGYSPVNPGTRLLQGMQVGGYEEFAFESPDEAVEFLGAEGGLLTLWKGELDIAVLFPPTQEGADAKGKERAGKGDRAGQQGTSLREASISVNDTFFRFDRDLAKSMEVATDVRALFLDLCLRLDAHYGYSYDEYILEFFHYILSIPIQEIEGKIMEAARAQRPPAFLFWLQYFSLEYAKRLPLATIKDMGGIVRELPSGFMLSFFDWPWEEQRSSKLESLNKEWRKLYQA